MVEDTFGDRRAAAERHVRVSHVRRRGFRALDPCRTRRTLRDELAVILRAQEEGSDAADARRPFGVVADHAADRRRRRREVLRVSKSMPHLATVRCVRCSSENEKLEVQKSLRARGGRRAYSPWGRANEYGGAFAGPGGESDPSRYRALSLSLSLSLVYCLRHGMEGCSHAPACRVLEVKHNVDAIKAVMEAPVDGLCTPSALFQGSATFSKTTRRLR